jgi:hypothetical protein
MTALQEALNANGCERLKDFYNVGPVQRAAVESFVAALAQQGEPVAYLIYDKGASSQYVCFDDELGDMDGLEVTPLYTAAPAPQAPPEVGGGEFVNGVWRGVAAPQPVVNQQMTTVKESLTPQSAQPVAAWTDGKGYVTTSQTIAEHHAANGEPMTPIAPPVAAQPMTDDEYERMTTRGASAWDGVDPQELRTGLAPLTDDQIWFLWASENGLEDCNMCKYDDFKKVFRYVENACGIKGAK